MKTSLQAFVVVGLFGTGLAWGGPIFSTASKVPSNLITPVGPQSGIVQKFTSIACYDFSSGNLVDCGFDFTITGLHAPAGDPDNNGGHTHDPGAHPVGSLSVVAPVPSGPSTTLVGQTLNDIVVVSHEIPQVSGKIDTVLNLRVPPGWHTVTPESCTPDRTSWCFFTTIDVGLPGLTVLPGDPAYTKLRKPDNSHTDAVAFFGTPETNTNLAEIADFYNLLTDNILSVNDMSLVRGGVFDFKDNFTGPHQLHRVGNSADINKAQGDCTVNYDLAVAVNFVMPAEAGSNFAKRAIPSFGRFLCEPNGNIHIDFDTVPPPPPSPFQ
jgi:hypothetical protein